MFPWQVLTRIAGIAVITTAAGVYLSKKAFPKTDDMVEASIRFKKGFDEFQKGFETMIFGKSSKSPEDLKKKREETRIEIE